MRSVTTRLFTTFFLAAIISGVAFAADAVDVWNRVDHHFVNNGDLKIHYVTLGDGKPILFIHGFPDIWYSLRHQMHTRATDYRTSEMDLRDYNKCDQTNGVEHCALSYILKDVETVIDDLGGQVTLAGHDWGGASR